MLINMKEMLAVADKNEFAVPAFNIGSEAILRVLLRALTRRMRPLSLQFTRQSLNFWETAL